MHLFIGCLLLLGIWLLIIGKFISGFVFIVLYVISFILITNQRLVITDNQELIVYSMLKKKTVFLLGDIKKIELQYGISTNNNPKSDDGLLRLILSGIFPNLIQSINLSIYEPEHVFEFLEVLCMRIGNPEVDENIQSILNGETKELKSKIYKRALVDGVKANLK